MQYSNKLYSKVTYIIEETGVSSKELGRIKRVFEEFRVD